jgi:hypothetical protein
LKGRPPVFSASGSAAGYYYQARLALCEGLRFVYRATGIDLSIERLDDVAFETAGNAIELLQTKHHTNRKGDLSDKSADLWKTLRVWAEAVKKDPSLPQRTRFMLITTGRAPTDSAASFLRPEVDRRGARDTKKAEALLCAAAAESENIELTYAIEAFETLTLEMRSALIAAVEVLDEAPNVVDLEAAIEDGLKLLAPRGKLAEAREQLEGWWWPRICRALQAGPGTISIFEIEAKLDDIRDVMRRNALPADMEYLEPPAGELDALNEMVFVRQLRAVGLAGRRVENAKRDYYRAFAQRSRWVRENLIFDGEVAHFEANLVEEWEPRFDQMCDGLGQSTDSGVLRRAGQALYAWVETEARFPFRTLTKRFLTVGSYHILAEGLRLGWHRDYAVLMAKNKKEAYAD